MFLVLLFACFPIQAAKAPARYLANLWGGPELSDQVEVGFNGAVLWLAEASYRSYRAEVC